MKYNRPSNVVSVTGNKKQMWDIEDKTFSNTVGWQIILSTCRL